MRNADALRHRRSRCRGAYAVPRTVVVVTVVVIVAAVVVVVVVAVVVVIVVAGRGGQMPGNHIDCVTWWAEMKVSDWGKGGRREKAK